MNSKKTIDRNKIYDVLVRVSDKKVIQFRGYLHSVYQDIEGYDCYKFEKLVEPGDSVVSSIQGLASNFYFN